MKQTMKKQIRRIAFMLVAAVIPAVIPMVLAQAPTMKQLMLDLIHPASNDILLAANRGGPADDKEWAAVRHSALSLEESGNVLIGRGPANQENWVNAAKMLADAGTAAYKASQDKDVKALAAVTVRIDASCTNCHKQYRPNVFPQGGSK